MFLDQLLNIKIASDQWSIMSQQRIEGKERKEHGKAEEKIGKEFDNPDREVAGKTEKEYGAAEEKTGRKKEKVEY